MSTTRREFLRIGAAMVGAGCSTGLFGAGEETGADAVSASSALPGGRLIGSVPVLMNPAERTMDVVFAVNGDANGWVEISKSPDMAKSVRVHSGGDNPLMTIRDGFASIRISGLRPATKYYYRIGADRIRFDNNYKISHHGTEAKEKVYSFTTLGHAVCGSFCVIQDTHSRAGIVERCLKKVMQISPAAIVWNGDARNFYKTANDAIGTFLKPHSSCLDYAVSSPVMFLNGNHDFRGRFARRLHELVQFRDVRERSPQFAGLGRNFVQRLGDIALIGLDTGEDKQDTNPIMCGTSRMTKCRELQTRWLAEEIENPAIKTAKFKVAFCHIPLCERNPRANPGDILPADDNPRYKHPWAAWQRTCAKMWGPLFEKAGVRLVLTGHQHVFRYDPPAPGRTWAHLVGGQRDVIHGCVEGGRLVVRVHDAATNTIRKELKFP